MGRWGVGWNMYTQTHITAHYIELTPLPHPLLFFPDDLQVMRNDEWDKTGGVGCGMSGNNC